MIEKRGWASEEDLQELHEAGYTRQTALDVVMGIGLKTLSNYTNHITHTPVDTAFQSATWTKE